MPLYTRKESYTDELTGNRFDLVEISAGEMKRVHDDNFGGEQRDIQSVLDKAQTLLPSEQPNEAPQLVVYRPPSPIGRDRWRIESATLAPVHEASATTYNLRVLCRLDAHNQKWLPVAPFAAQLANLVVDELGPIKPGQTNNPTQPPLGFQRVPPAMVRIINRYVAIGSNYTVQPALGTDIYVSPSRDALDRVFYTYAASVEYSAEPIAPPRKIDPFFFTALTPPYAEAAGRLNESYARLTVAALAARKSMARGDGICSAEVLSDLGKGLADFSDRIIEERHNGWISDTFALTLMHINASLHDSYLQQNLTTSRALAMSMNRLQGNR